MTPKIPDEGTLLRIFIGDSDSYGGKPLHEAIVLRAREMHLAGATVFKGIMGFGKNSRLRAAKFVELSPDLPVLVEIIDSKQKIDTFLPVLDEMITNGLVTLETVQVVKYVADADTEHP
jgi:PII-like signaling protein